MKNGAWIVLSCLVGLLLGCTQVTTVQIGVAVSETGPNAKIGIAVRDGVKLAVDEWNRAGGVNGKSVKILLADDSGDPAKAVEVAKSLCDQGALAVIGHIDSGCSLKARDIYLQRGVIMVTPTSTHPDITERGEGKIFRVCGRDDVQGKEAAIWLIRQQLPGTVAVVHDGGLYGQRLATEFKSNYEFLSGTKVVLEEPLTTAGTDLAATVAKVKAANPAVVYFGGMAKPGGEFLKALAGAGLKVLFISGDGCFSQDFLDAAGAEAAEGARITFIQDLNTLPANRLIVDAYRQTYGDPGPFGLAGYEAASVILNAAAQSAPPLNGRNLADALHRITFKTIAGLVKFNEKGDPTETPYVVWRVEGGKFWE